MLASSFVNEEDHFCQRLEHINKEMKAIIERTGAERNQLLNMEVRNSLTRNVPDGLRAGGVSHASFSTPLGATPSVSLHPGLTSSHEVSEDMTVRRLIDERVGELRGSFAQMLSETIANLNFNIQQRLDDAQKTRLDFTESLRETADTARRGVNELQNAFSRMRRTVDRPVEELARELQEHVSRSTQENTRMRDAIASLENEVRVERQRGDRRMDELVRRHHDLVRNSLLELDAHVDGLRDELQMMVRLQNKQVMEELNATQQQVARLHGALEAINDTTARWVAELRNLMEDNVKQHSEIQSLKAEVASVSALVKQMSAQATTPAADRSAVNPEGRNGTPLNKSSCDGGVCDGSPDAMKSLKYNIKQLASDMMRMGRQIACMDNALRSLFASRDASLPRDPYGGRRLPPPVPDASHGRFESNGYGSVSVSMNSRACSQFPFSCGASPASDQERHQRHTTGDRSQRGVGVSAGASTPPGKAGSVAAVSPVSESSPQCSVGEGRHPQQRQQHSPIHNRHRDNTGRSAESQLNPTQNSKVTANESGRLPGASATSVDREAIPLPNTLLKQDKDNLSSPPLKLSMQASPTSAVGFDDSSPPPRGAPPSKSPTPPDSYVSSPNSVVVHRVDGTQYNPAPTSDLESELDNKKIARLALD